MLRVPLGTVVRVTAANGRSVTLLVNDHGPYVGDRIIDVSQRANRILDLGLGIVRVEVLRPA
jgi:rare lipoprotein A